MINPFTSSCSALWKRTRCTPGWNSPEACFCARRIRFRRGSESDSRRCAGDDGRGARHAVEATQHSSGGSFSAAAVADPGKGQNNLPRRCRSWSFRTSTASEDSRADGREYAIYLGPNACTPVPWINVMANPVFGALVSEAGSGYCWYGNSQSNRLTPWNNDPVSDPADRGDLYSR